MSVGGPVEPRVASVVVAFHSDPEKLVALCRRLRSEGSAVVVVDNTPAESAEHLELPDGCVLHRLGRNEGVAAGFNVGVRHALASGAEVVVLFDDDSEVRDGFLRALVRPLVPGEAGVAAPVALDKVTGQEYPSRRIGRLGLPREVFAAGRGRHGAVEVDVVISSGCAATAETYRRVGLLDESLFVDFVDTEWCLRCRASGVHPRVVPDAVLLHQIGDAPAGRANPLYRGLVHAPERAYYRLRNALLLLRNRHAPLLFAVRESLAVMGHLGIQVVIRSERRARLKWSLLGLRDGLLGVRGRGGGL